MRVGYSEFILYAFGGKELLEVVGDVLASIVASEPFERFAN
jgi:hypothetical protein